MPFDIDFAPKSSYLKVNDHAGGWSPTAYAIGIEQDITVTSPLVFDTNIRWPVGSSGSETELYNFSTNKWLENAVLDQTHIWDFEISFSRALALTAEIITLHVRETVSGAHKVATYNVPIGVLSGTVNIVMDSTVTADSIGVGYVASLEVTQIMTMTIESLTRISY